MDQRTLLGSLTRGTWRRCTAMRETGYRDPSPRGQALVGRDVKNVAFTTPVVVDVVEGGVGSRELRGSRGTFQRCERSCGGGDIHA